jgi:pyridoxine 5-phosphate synthase
MAGYSPADLRFFPGDSVLNPWILSGQPAAGHAFTALSVNVNKVALLRNTRSLGIPDVLRFARRALQAGASGITVHPRPDERHIRRHDVLELAELMKDWPQCEFNMEGNPMHNLLPLAQEVVRAGGRVHQCTFVPDTVAQATSDHGWNLPQDVSALQPLVQQAHDFGARVSLFMDPVAQAMEAAHQTGAQRVELYTESYARAAASSDSLALAACLDVFAQSARAAQSVGLGVNAGHDLNQQNLAGFLKAVPGVLEVSIGHALVADALDEGVQATVQAYLACMGQLSGTSQPWASLS